MKRILIMSDSHGSDNIGEIMRKEKHDLVIHCGDSEKPFNSKLMQQIRIKVKGNCDFDNLYPESIEITVDGVKILVVHGHHNNVNYGLEELAGLGKEKDIDLILYGHTHVARSQELEGVLLINPGSTKMSRSENPESYCIVEISDGKIVNHIFKRVGEG